MKKLLKICVALSLITGFGVINTVTVDAHGSHSHEKLPHQEGIFEDSEVKDRALTDWSGDWQSVYPYLKAGELDMVMRYKAKSTLLIVYFFLFQILYSPLIFFQ